MSEVALVLHFAHQAIHWHFCRYIGVDHVFVYDNNEDHGTQALGVQDYIDQQFVTWHLLDGAAFSGGIQTAAYQHCLSTYGPYVSWLAEIDADEYLSVEDPAARQLPPARRLKAVLGDFRFMPGGIQKVSIQCLLQFHTTRRKALSPLWRRPHFCFACRRSCETPCSLHLPQTMWLARPEPHAR